MSFLANSFGGREDKAKERAYEAGQEAFRKHGDVSDDDLYNLAVEQGIIDKECTCENVWIEDVIWHEFVYGFTSGFTL